MVFLIIEKIKGRPLSLKTQMVATLVGLATIILVFVLVTFKDITHLLN
jgi:membrane-associated protease RseP (regulator of RpoE activity)